MMTLYTESGEEKQVMDDAEIEALKAPGTALQELMQELGAEKPEDLKILIKDLKESENPNWKAAREKISNLEKLNAELAKQGKMLNDAGQIVDKTGLNAEEIIKQAKEGARMELIQEKMEDSLDGINEEEKKVVMHYYNKLSAGEEITLRNVDKFLTEAKKLANVESSASSTKQSANRIGSSVSNTGGGNKNFADTDAGKNLLGMMGLATPDKK
jgi:hypothetical protein